jgi:hypothetical protein
VLPPGQRSAGDASGAARRGARALRAEIPALATAQHPMPLPPLWARRSSLAMISVALVATASERLGEGRAGDRLHQVEAPQELYSRRRSNIT